MHDIVIKIGNFKSTTIEVCLTSHKGHKHFGLSSIVHSINMRKSFLPSLTAELKLAGLSVGLLETVTKAKTIE